MSDDVLKLAESLRRNGIVSSHGEAIHMAEQMLGRALGEAPHKIDLGVDFGQGNKPLREVVEEVDINLKKMPADPEQAEAKSSDEPKGDEEQNSDASEEEDDDTIVFKADEEE